MLGAISSNPQQPARAVEISEELHRGSALVSELHERLKVLHARLEPCSNKQEPTGEKSLAQAPRKTPIGGAIQELNGGVANATSIVNGLIERLEI